MIEPLAIQSYRVSTMNVVQLVKMYVIDPDVIDLDSLTPIVQLIKMYVIDPDVIDLDELERRKEGRA